MATCSTLTKSNRVLDGAEAARDAARLRVNDKICGLLTENPKVKKGRAKGYVTSILHLSPAKLSGYQVCPMATEGCRNACLNASGQGRIIKRGSKTNAVQTKRVLRTLWYMERREEFMAQLVHEVELAIRRAKRNGLTPVFRLNGTSDLRFETVAVTRNGERYPSIFEAFSDVQFYDYTKLANRRVAHIPNYHLTFSVADGNEASAIAAAKQGTALAVVFRTKDVIPETYEVGGMVIPVVNGDEDDLRFLDGDNVVVALYAKGYGRYDTSGFVKDTAKLTLPVLTVAA